MKAGTLALLGGAPLAGDLRVPHWPSVGRDADAVSAKVRADEIAYSGRQGEVLRLEERFATRFGCHALALNSGTSALHSAYFALGIGNGDEVLAPTYTFHATVMPLVALGAVPVLVDADSSTGNIDVSQLDALVTGRTKAVVVTHINGVPVDMHAVNAFARRRGLAVVEDCSHAHAAEVHGKPVGTFGDATAFSLQGNKLVPAGEGGILLTPDPKTFERALLLGHWARCADEVRSSDLGAFVTTGLGLNYQMHALGAALANEALTRLDDVVAAREANFRVLDEALKGVPGVRPPTTPSYVSRRSCYNYQPRYVEGEVDVPLDVFVQAVRAEGVPATRPTSPPLHCLPLFRDGRDATVTPRQVCCGEHAPEFRRYEPNDLPGSVEYMTTTFRLPVYSDVDVRTMDQIACVIEKVVRNADALRCVAAESRLAAGP